MTHIPGHPEQASVELVRRAADLVPLLRTNAERCARERRVPAENLKALREAGLATIALPRAFGGAESDIRTKLAAYIEVARGCGSTAWVSTIYTDTVFLLSLFPDEVQDEVFADPEAFHCATLIPAGRAVRTDGGYLVSGRWPFNSGCLDATWCVQPAVLAGDEPEVMHFVIPTRELSVEDDWFVSGLQGSGSNTMCGTDIFVPTVKALSMARVLSQNPASARNAESGLYHAPLLPYLLTSAAGSLIGMAKHAYELHVDRLPERGPIAYTGYPSHREAPITHQVTAEARMKIDAAEALSYQAAALMQDRRETGAPYGPEDKPRVWGLISYAVRLCTEAVEMLRNAAGATGIGERMPIQQVARDVQALSTHASMLPNTGIEHYGRALCGLPPTTPLL
ncbi:acyl-CoA dehydrogenase family protein [Actinokineospora enzanensis]|uniref:acyl-CoA dehydrogenase family protein n=1 Tax=Actinokineospora enzanensis TaxID=155975 RepID=UPI00037F3385|nr:acyl-CoA dehydrogenase family protein [Actinokineospora enzanensis]